MTCRRGEVPGDAHQKRVIAQCLSLGCALGVLRACFGRDAGSSGIPAENGGAILWPGAAAWLHHTLAAATGAADT